MKKNRFNIRGIDAVLVLVGVVGCAGSTRGGMDEDASSARYLPRAEQAAVKKVVEAPLAQPSTYSAPDVA